MKNSFLEVVKREIKKSSDPERAKFMARYFKTGKGQYAEGDKFYGLTAPQIRAFAKKYEKIATIRDIEMLLETGWHEERVMALVMLVKMYQKAGSGEKKKIAYFYLDHTDYINNWDLVDISAPKIIGNYLYENPVERKLLIDLAKSPNLWRRRIAVLSTMYFIGQGRFDETLMLAEMLLNDKHDLMHKAVGWALREVGKRDMKALTEFLNQKKSKTPLCCRMPRTMLRYAIEKFPESERQRYLKMKE